MTSSTFTALAATPLLAGLNAVALTLLENEGTVLAFAAGDIIVREGDVEVIKRHGGDEPVLLARLHRGTFFGEMCVVDPVPRAATVRAQTKVTAIEIKAATLHHLFQQLPDQYAIMLLNLARRLRSLDEAFAARAS